MSDGKFVKYCRICDRLLEEHSVEQVTFCVEKSKILRWAKE